ncbi:MAG TPA: tyrosine-type recombinase/integrase [Pyrinomonadaceae bacterium]|nr:tyrosine-type recombinase/integrase [Pyrinomonadaceae bacterium]
MSTTDLRLRLEGYLSLRQALGFSMRATTSRLNDFVKFIEEKGHSGPITAQLAVEWSCSTASACGASGQAQRLSMVRCFLSYLRATVPETEIPDKGLLAKAPRPNPYIYSPTEIQSLLAAASLLGPDGSLRPHTFSTLIGLLASTGLRSGEAIRLTVTDVQLDLAPPRLLVRLSKFRKSRIVPLHATTARMLRRYSKERARLGYDAQADAFFISEQRRPLHYSAVRRTFETLRRGLGITTSNGRTPKLHGLRHSFAVQRLLTWYREGADVKARLPNLSIYLGHVCPQDSYWYLTATPELLSAAASSFQTYANSGGAA